MKLRHTPRGDASTIIGMQSPGAYGVTGMFLAAAAIAMLGPGCDGLVAKSAVVVLLAVGALVLLAVPGDPFPRWWSLVVAALPSTSVAVVLTVTSTAGSQTQEVTTTVGGGAALCAFLCARGRVTWGWAGQAVAFVTFGTLGPGFVGAASTFVTCAGVMLMATFFARVVRPAAASIYGLREARALQIAEKAAADAAQEERARQLRRLDDLARPLLRRIAQTPLDDDARREARLAEATLRDSIRARALDVGEITTAARGARARGVTVQLLDDGGLTGQDRDVVARVHTAIAGRLDDTAWGSMTVRVHPPGRSTLVTIVVTQDDETERYEIHAPI